MSSYSKSIRLSRKDLISYRKHMKNLCIGFEDTDQCKKSREQMAILKKTFKDQALALYETYEIEWLDDFDKEQY